MGLSARTPTRDLSVLPGLPHNMVSVSQGQLSSEMGGGNMAEAVSLLCPSLQNLLSITLTICPSPLIGAVTSPLSLPSVQGNKI